jgi:AbrB family transcriptional regulator, transcriptional pleiotropic regulator of transition state genes
MKPTGTVRKLDDLGRLVLPITLRRQFGIKHMDGLEIFTDAGGLIVLRKYVQTCVFCESSDELINFKDKKVCKACMAALTEDDGGGFLPG